VSLYSENCINTIVYGRNCSYHYNEAYLVSTVLLLGQL